jgi:hypothetical protein
MRMFSASIAPKSGNRHIAVDQLAVLKSNPVKSVFATAIASKGP